MEKVKMVVMGKPALVDSDMAKKIARKQELVSMLIEMGGRKDPNEKILDLSSKIIRLNRTIRTGCVQFI